MKYCAETCWEILVSRLDSYDFPTPLHISIGAACYPTHAVDSDSLRTEAVSRPVVNWDGDRPPRRKASDSGA